MHPHLSSFCPFFYPRKSLHVRYMMVRILLRPPLYYSVAVRLTYATNTNGRKHDSRVAYANFALATGSVVER